MTAASTTLPTTSTTPLRSYGTAWWGTMMLIATEATVFLILIASYFFLRSASKEWPLGGIEVPELRLALPFSFVLWGSSLPVFWVEAAVRKGRIGAVRAALALAWFMGAAFVASSLKDFRDLHYGWRDNAYGSIVYTLVGLHLAHVVVGLTMSLVVQAKAWSGRISAERHTTVEVFALYWHFVDVVWLAVFPTVFLSPRWR